MIQVKVYSKEKDGKTFTHVYLVMKDNQKDMYFAVAPLPCATNRTKRYFYDLCRKRCDKVNHL